MKKIICSTLLITFLFSQGCNYIPEIPIIHKQIHCWISPGLDKYNPDTYAIMPFKPPQITKSKYGNIGEIVSDAFETAFLQTGNRIVERSKFQTILKEQRFSLHGYTEEDSIEIGKMVNADAVILGVVMDFSPAKYNDPERPNKATSCTTISFSVRAIHVESGEILWKGNVTKSTGYRGSMLYRCDYNLIKYSNKVANDLVKKLHKTMLFR